MSFKQKYQYCLFVVIDISFNKKYTTKVSLSSLIFLLIRNTTNDTFQSLIFLLIRNTTNVSLPSLICLLIRNTNNNSLFVNTFLKSARKSKLMLYMSTVATFEFEKLVLNSSTSYSYWVPTDHRL